MGGGLVFLVPRLHVAFALCARSMEHINGTVLGTLYFFFPPDPLIHLSSVGLC